MTEKGYKGGLYSRVKNRHSSKKYIISTAQEIGKDYWTTVVAPSKFFGLWMDFKKRVTWVRNSMDDAHKVHQKLKEIVANLPEDEWMEAVPSPKPPGGYSRDARQTFDKKLGFVPD